MAASAAHDVAAPAAAENRLKFILEQYRKDTCAPKLNISDRCCMPSFGVTCVAALSRESIAEFVDPLWSLIKGQRDVDAALLLLPASSMHVTIRGLEDCMLREDVLPKFRELDHALVQTSGFSTLMPAGTGGEASPSTAAGTATTATASSATPSYPLRWKLEGVGMWRTSCVLRVSVEPKETVDMLNHNVRDKLSLDLFTQRYHITLGYWITSDESLRKQAGAAIRKALRTVCGANADADDEGTSMKYSLQAPRVCAYESMEAFPPLFGDVIE